MKQSGGVLARIRVAAGLVAVVLTGGVPVAEAALTFSANAIASDGAITLSGAVGSALTLGAAAQVGTVSLGVSTAELALNLGTGNGAKTINIGNGTGADSINIGTGGTAADTIIIGDSAANVSLTDAQWGITAPGAATFTGLTLTGFSGVLKTAAGVVAGSATTSDLTEGTNLYYTDTRARAALSGTAPINYTSATGVIALDTVGATKGGTGLTSYTTGDLLYASAANTLSALAGNTTTTRKFLRQTGDGAASAAPAWDTVTKTDVGLGSVENTALTTWAGSTSLTTLGTVATGSWNATAIGVAKGGTNLTTIAAGSVLAANTINTLSAVTSTVDTKVLTNTAGTISWEAAAATGANTALSNLASVAINAALIPATAGGLDFGTTAKPWADLYLAGTSITPGTNQYKLTGASTGGLRTITLPDASGTVSLLGNTVTGSGSVVLATSPSLTTPNIGVATATSVNKLTLTAPATTATLTIAEGKTLTASNTLTFSGTDGSSLAIGTGGTLGTGAYATIANYAPLASPSFTTPNIGVATATSIAIGANTLDTSEWANLDGVNQGLATTSTPRFARVGLGQAADASAVLSATGQYFSTQYTTTTTLDWNNGNVQYIQLANNGQTFTFANPKSGARYMLILKQPASGAAGTITWPATVRWPAGTEPTLTTTNSRTDIVTFVYDGTNALYYGGASLNYLP